MIDETKRVEDFRRNLLKRRVFGKWLQLKRKELNLHQYEFAEMLNLTKQVYNKYERGSVYPRNPESLMERVIILSKREKALRNGNESIVFILLVVLYFSHISIKAVEQTIKYFIEQQYKDFGEYLINMREAANIEFYKLAELINLDEETLLNYEEGKELPADTTLFLNRFNAVIRREIVRKRQK